MQMIFRRLSTILLLFVSLIIITLPLASSEKMTTYYDVLGVSKDCTLKDIKKSFRALALKYHPDRVPLDKKEKSTMRFREVSEAYEILSDTNSRSDYDRSLKYGGGDSGGNSNNGGHQQRQQQHHHQQHQYYHNQQHRHRDPFSQFNDLFQNDPFFNDAFKDMDDLFAKTFQQNNNNNKNNMQHQHHNHNHNQNQIEIKKQDRGWGGWLLDKVVDKLGIDVHVSSSYNTNAGTSHSTTNYGRSAASASSSSSGTNTRSTTYTSKSTKTVIENGRRITIQSMEKDGNKIEEKYFGNNLVQRLVNGRPQNIGRIEEGGDGDDL
jgi:curved DNA-binding protein CbpA